MPLAGPSLNQTGAYPAIDRVHCLLISNTLNLGQPITNAQAEASGNTLTFFGDVDLPDLSPQLDVGSTKDIDAFFSTGLFFVWHVGLLPRLLLCLPTPYV